MGKNVTEKRRMKTKFKRDIQESWTFLVAGAIFILLTFIPNVSDDLLGISNLLMRLRLLILPLRREKYYIRRGKII